MLNEIKQIAQPEHLQRAQQFKRLNARYTQIQDLLSVGAYRAGVDSETDVAIHYRQAMQGFMRQGLTESISFAEAQYALNNLFTPLDPLNSWFWSCLACFGFPALLARSILNNTIALAHPLSS